MRLPADSLKTERSIWGMTRSEKEEEEEEAVVEQWERAWRSDWERNRRSTTGIDSILRVSEAIVTRWGKEEWCDVFVFILREGENVCIYIRSIYVCIRVYDQMLLLSFFLYSLRPK